MVLYVWYVPITCISLWANWFYRDIVLWIGRFVVRCSLFVGNNET